METTGALLSELLMLSNKCFLKKYMYIECWATLPEEGFCIFSCLDRSIDRGGVTTVGTCCTQYTWQDKCHVAASIYHILTKQH